MPEVVPPTLSERLHAVLAKHAKDIAAKHAEDGSWSSRKEGAPYVIDSKDGKTRIRVTNEDGDTISGVGPTIEDALVALEGK